MCITEISAVELVASRFLDKVFFVNAMQSIELLECVKGELKSPLSIWRPKHLSPEFSGKP